MDIENASFESAPSKKGLLVREWGTGDYVKVDNKTEAMEFLLLRFNFYRSTIHVHYKVPTGIRERLEEQGIEYPFTNDEEPFFSFLVDSNSLSTAYIVADDETNKLNMDKVAWLVVAAIELNFSARRVLPSDINTTEVINILDVTRYFNMDKVVSSTDYFRHLIANHEMDIDMTKGIDYAMCLVDIDQ